MKKLLKISSLAIIFLSFAVCVQAQKFGYVNSAAILAELPEVKQADSALEGLQKAYQKKGRAMMEDLQKDYQAIQEKVGRGELSRIQQEEEAKKLKEKENEIASYEQEMLQKIQEKRNELLEPIYKKVNDAISAVAKENGYQFIFNQQVLLYFDASQDVGNLVRAKLGLPAASASNGQ